MRQLWIVASLCLGACAAPPPCECPTAAPPAPIDARAEFEAGEIQFNLGNFERAAERFTRAYEADPRPALLYNIGQCYWHLEDFAKAVYLFESYLREDPDAPNREEVEQLIRQGEARATKE